MVILFHLFGSKTLSIVKIPNEKTELPVKSQRRCIANGKCECCRYDEMNVESRQISNRIIKMVKTIDFSVTNHHSGNKKKKTERAAGSSVLSLEAHVEIVELSLCFHTMEIKKYDFECDETEVMILLRFSWSFIVGVGASLSLSLSPDSLSFFFLCFSVFLQWSRCCDCVQVSFDVQMVEEASWER